MVRGRRAAHQRVPGGAPGAGAAVQAEWGAATLEKKEKKNQFNKIFVTTQPATVVRKMEAQSLVIAITTEAVREAAAATATTA